MLLRRKRFIGLFSGTLIGHPRGCQDIVEFDLRGVVWVAAQIVVTNSLQRDLGPPRFEARTKAW